MDRLPTQLTSSDKRITTPTAKSVAAVRANARSVVSVSSFLPAVSTDRMQLQVPTHRAAVLETLGTRWDVIRRAVEQAMECSDMAERLLNMKSYVQILVEGRDVEIFRHEKGYVITVSNGVQETTYQVDTDGQLTTFSTNFYKGATGEGTVVPVLLAGPHLHYELKAALNNKAQVSN